MTFEKSTVYISTDKLVNKDGKEIYVFPDPLPPHVEHKDDKYHIKVEYCDPEAGDISLSEEYTKALAARGVSGEDVLKACKAGIRLACGDAVKSEFATDGTGVKAREKALQWAAKEQPKLVGEWSVNFTTKGKAEADRLLLAAYNAR